MRLPLVLTTLITVLLILSLDSTSAQLGGGFDTDTTLSIPTGLQDGDSVTVTSTTTYSGGPVFLGQTTIYHLNDVRIEGGADIGTSISITDPTLEFSVASTMTLRAMRIPITSVSSDSVLQWIIKDSSATVLADGEINTDELTYANQEGSLMLAIGSFQSDDTINDNKYANGISLTSGTYSVTLSQVSVLDFSASASNSYQGVYSYQDGIVQSTFPQLYLLGGSHRTRSNVLNGQASSTFTVSTGISYVLAYYGDGGANFAPSHAFNQIDVVSTSPLTVSMADYNSSPGSTVSFIANVLDSTTPVVGANVDFKINQAGVYTSLGSSTSNSVGDAQLIYTVDISPGTYNIEAEANYNSQYGLDYSNLTITTPIVVFENLDAMGTYGSAGFGLTASYISGYVKTQGGSPIANAPITISDDTTVLAIINSDNFGYFEYNHVVNQVVGTYVNYYNVKLVDGFWDPIPVYTDLVINRGQLIVTALDISEEFINQPVYITGDVKNIPGENIISTINLEKETAPSTWILVDSVVDSTFNFQQSGLAAGSYNYRIQIDQTANYMSATEGVIISIGQSNAQISRGILPTTFEIQYHENYDLSVNVQQMDLSAIEGAVVTASAWDPNIGNFYEIGSGTSDATGKATLVWIPDERYLHYPEIPWSIKYTAVHNDFVISEFQVSFTITATDITVSLQNNVWTYDTPETLIFETVDTSGYVANEGTKFDVAIEGTLYAMTIDNTGKGYISHTFSNVGSASMSVSNTAYYPFPYNAYTDTLLFTINRGGYIITGSDMTVSRGESVVFSTSITDHNANILPSPTTASLWLFDVTWIQLGDDASTNEFTIPYDIVQNEGIFTFEWRIAESAQYNAAVQSCTLTVSKSATELLFTQVPTTYNFNDIAANRQVTITLQVPVLNNPIIGEFVSVDFNSQSGSYSWFLQSDNDGQISFVLLQQPIVGTYTLTASFVGNSDYQSSSNSAQVVILGIDTILSWKTVPLDGYYGENQLVSVHLEDVFGNVLEGFVIDLTIGTDTFTATTNATGDATLNINMFYEGSLDISVVQQAKDGWNGNSITTIIQIEKKQLIIVSEINSILYSPTNNNQDLDFAIFINSNNDPFLFNIKLEMYWLNPATSQFEFLTVYYTDASGYVSVSMSFPAINAGEAYLFSWIASDQDFEGEQLDSFYTVVPMPIDVTISYGSGNYKQKIPVDFTVRDDKGLLISDLTVYMSYSDVVLLWSDSAKTWFGATSIDFVALAVGDLMVYYSVSDPNGNYILKDGTILISIATTNTLIDYTINDIQGTVWLTIDVSDPEMKLVSEGSVVLHRWDATMNNWMLENQVDLDLFNSVVIPVNSDTQQYKIVYLDNSHYIGSQHIFNLYRQDLMVNNHPFEMDVGDNLNIYLLLSGNSSIDDYTVDIFVSDDGLDWENYATIFSVNGVVNESIPINLPIASYQLKVVIPQQGWYKQLEQIYPFNINFNQFRFTINQDQFLKDRNNELLVTVNSTAPDAISNVQLDLYIIVDMNKIHLSTAFSDIDGNAMFEFILTQEYGTYTFSVESVQTALVKSSNYEFPAIIGHTLQVEFIVIDSIDFDFGGTIIVVITDHLNVPVNNYKVDLFKNAVNVNNTDLLFFFETLYTDSLGSITIDVSELYLYSSYIKFSLNISNPLVIGQIVFEQTYIVELGISIINYVITDYGTTQSTVILLNVTDGKGEFITVGKLNWKLKNGIHTILEGTSNLVFLYEFHNYIIEIPAVYMGEYQLIIDFVELLPQDRYVDSSIIIDIGWTKVGTKAQLVTEEVKYRYSNVSLLITDFDDGHPLADISVSVWVNDEQYSTVTDNKGLLWFMIEILPGNYEIRVEISGSLLVHDLSSMFNLTVTKGEAQINLNIPEITEEIPSQVSLQIYDEADMLGPDSEYSVEVYRDGVIVNDVTWTINGIDQIIITPTFAETNAISTQSNHLSRLYPGTYKVELTRTHPYFVTESLTQEFVVLPRYIDFTIDTENSNNTVYVVISYDNSTDIDVEFSVLLDNQDLEKQVTYYGRDRIEIPWTQGTINIIVTGMGYVTGDASRIHTIVSNSTVTNSTVTDIPENQIGIDNLVDKDNTEMILIATLGTSAVVPTTLKYIKKKRRKGSDV